MRGRTASVLLLCPLAVSLASCPLPASDSLPISVSSDKITLEWDPPPGHSIPPLVQITSYRIYYARHLSDRWIFLGEVPATEHPQHTLHHDELGDGFFDLAVTAVNSVGAESARHTSLDFTSSPVGGWYIRWFLSR